MHERRTLDARRAGPPGGTLLLAIALAALLMVPAAALATLREWEVSLARPGAHELLVSGGFDIASARPGASARILADDAGAARLRGLGFSPRLIDSDPGRHMAERAERELGVRVRARALGVPQFGTGGMGGYYTDTEIRAYVDSLIAADTHGLFTPVDTIGLTWRGRPVWTVRMTGAGAGPKPRVLITSLIHAREPEGMQALLYFLSQLASSYGTDPDLTYLVDQREIYFIPLINPDGYAVNESTYAAGQGFGMWRKNARDNNGNHVLDALDGVDLNRNFGYKWGLDNVGSSNQQAADDYRGPAAWSEPETQAFRAFCDSLRFTTALNFHTYSDLFLFPWGYTTAGTPDSATFLEWADDFTRDNHYLYGESPRVLYEVNGETDDWLYGETVEKPRTFSMTIEVGNQDDGFYPAPSRILPLAQEQVRPLAGIVGLAGRLIRIQGPPQVGGDGWLHAGYACRLSFAVKNRGLTESSVGLLTATLRSSDGLSVPEDSISTWAPVAPGQTASPADTGMTVYVPIGTPPGSVLNFQVRFADDGGYSGTDSFQVVVGQPTTLFADNAESGVSAWTTGVSWAAATGRSHDPTHSFTDSPSGNYRNNTDNSLALRNPVSLAGAANAYLYFWGAWDIEQGFDFGTVELSADTGKTWTPLPGRFTRAGMGNAGNYAGGVQPLGSPGYDAIEYAFTEERMNLTPWAGPGKPAVKLRFRLHSDSGGTRDGLYVDGIRIVSYGDIAPPVAVGPGSPATRLAAGYVSPNPARGRAELAFSTPAAGRVTAAVYGVDGRRVATLADATLPAGAHRLSWDGRTGRGSRAAAGVYLVRVSAGGESATRRLVFLP